MFTGLIQEKGKVRKTGRRGGYRTVEITYEEANGKLRSGDSMAVDGVCLTATIVEPDFFKADLSEETCRSSTLGNLKAGKVVNLERPVSAADPLGGHIVLGHVDGVGRLRKVTPGSGGLRIAIQAPDAVMGMLVDKGSVAVDGVSLTVAAIGAAVFEVFLIPETRERTTLGAKRAGDEVNLEADYLAKLVRKFMSDDGMHRMRYPDVRGED